MSLWKYEYKPAFTSGIMEREMAIPEEYRETWNMGADGWEAAKSAGLAWYMTDGFAQRVDGLRVELASIQSEERTGGRFGYVEDPEDPSGTRMLRVYLVPRWIITRLPGRLTPGILLRRGVTQQFETRDEAVAHLDPRIDLGGIVIDVSPPDTN